MLVTTRVLKNARETAMTRNRIPNITPCFLSQTRDLGPWAVGVSSFGVVGEDASLGLPVEVYWALIYNQ